MNPYLVMSPHKVGYSLLCTNMEKEFHKDQKSFEPLRGFLKKQFLLWEDVQVFLQDFEKYFTGCIHTDPHVSLIAYEDKFIFISCPHIEGTRHHAAAYFIEGFNTLPEDALEGCGFWGGE